MPEGYVLYPVRQLPQGKVSYFNFPLAKEMGLIPKDHPHKLNKELISKILQAFNIRIINEYDQEKNKRFAKERVKPNQYMATRYLQLQHKNKQGSTSGDGRGIWNGTVKNRGKSWDVSSRGTGVTALAPGAVEANSFLESGNTDFGYGCGLAEIDELYSSAIMSEIMHLNGYSTERSLAIIEHSKGVGIGVRAGTNLFRPAHLFIFLKQNNYDALKRSTDLFIERQINNKEWDIDPNDKKRYYKALDIITDDFAKFAAYLERDYIFAWLDWDGDNVLGNAGIIDYGSIRQFGLRHDQYRYDDVERFSTNLNEQKTKAAQIVQTFCQLMDFIMNKSKKSIKDFQDHRNVQLFENSFQFHLHTRFLFQLGYTEKQADYLMLKARPLVEKLYKHFEILEKRKTKRKSEKTVDGVNRPAILNMRKMATILPAIINENKLDAPEIIPIETLFKFIASKDITTRDAQLSESIRANIESTQNLYSEVFNYLVKHDKKTSAKALKNQIEERSQLINSQHRLTGNSLIFVVSEIFRKKRGGLTPNEVQKIFEKLIHNQCLNPDTSLKQHSEPRIVNKRTQSLIKNILTIIDGYNEDI